MSATPDFRHRKIGWIESDRWSRFSVLLPLIRKDGEICVLFEKRAMKLDSQPGEVSFPGGRIEKGETPEEAVVRETCEELLVEKPQVEVFGRLDRLLSPSGRLIKPFVGTIHDYDMTFSEDEVEYPFMVPYRWFVEHEPKEFQNRLIQEVNENIPFAEIPKGRNYPWDKGTYNLYFYHWKDEVIWGMTAKILHASIPLIEEYDILSRI